MKVSGSTRQLRTARIQKSTAKHHETNPGSLSATAGARTTLESAERHGVQVWDYDKFCGYTKRAIAKLVAMPESGATGSGQPKSSHSSLSSTLARDQERKRMAGTNSSSSLMAGTHLSAISQEKTSASVGTVRRRNDDQETRSRTNRRLQRSVTAHQVVQKLQRRTSVPMLISLPSIRVDGRLPSVHGFSFFFGLFSSSSSCCFFFFFLPPVVFFFSFLFFELTAPRFHCGVVTRTRHGWHVRLIEQTVSPGCGRKCHLSDAESLRSP
jgi:hypothetical protein